MSYVVSKLPRVDFANRRVGLSKELTAAALQVAVGFTVICSITTMVVG